MGLFTRRKVRTPRGDTKAALKAELETLKRERAIERSAVDAFNHVVVRLGNIEESLAAIRAEHSSFLTRFLAKVRRRK